MSEAARGAARWIDISRPLDPERLVVWPGDEPLSSWLTARLDPDPRAGSPCNVTAARLSLHAGTHADLPRHFFAGGKAAEALDLETCFGPARLVRHEADRHLTAADLKAFDLKGARRLLLATTNAKRMREPAFREDYVALLPEAASRLVEEGVRLVGIDYLSIGPPGLLGEEVHRILLGAEVVVIEGLVLEGLPAGDYELAAFPLAVKGSDGAPVRAVLRPLANPRRSSSRR